LVQSGPFGQLLHTSRTTFRTLLRGIGLLLFALIGPATLCIALANIA